MTEEMKDSGGENPEQDAAVEAALPDLEFVVLIDQVQKLKMKEWAALRKPNKDPDLFIAGLKRITSGLDVDELRLEELGLVAERIGEAIEAAKAPKNSG